MCGVMGLTTEEMEQQELGKHVSAFVANSVPKLTSTSNVIGNR